MHDKKTINQAIKMFKKVHWYVSPRKTIKIDTKMCEFILNSNFYRNIRITKNQYITRLYFSNKNQYIYNQDNHRYCGYSSSCWGEVYSRGFINTIINAKNLSEIIAGFPSFAVQNK